MASHAEIGRKILDDAWAEVIAENVTDESPSELDAIIDHLLDGKEVGYKKLVVIQLSGKAADPSLDTHSLQKGKGDDRAWDAREFAKKVFVPWNAEIGYPLGQADDPYVSNQFRNKRFDKTIREKRKNKTLFDEAFAILAAAEAAKSAEEVVTLLKSVLRGIRRLMQKRSFDYPVPARASLEAVLGCITEYVSEASGGTRLQAVAHALFEGLASAGVPYKSLEARHVNAADSSIRSPGDVCFNLNDRHWAAEVKDRKLTDPQVEVSVGKARVADVTELLFLVQGSKADDIYESDDAKSAIEAIARREFSSGLNVYCESFASFARAVLVLIGETGRRELLKAVGQSLELQKADARHRWEWSRAVRQL